MYKYFFHLVFRRMDPERAHHLAFRWIRLVARVPGLRTFVAAVLAPRHRELRTEALGLRLHSPFGLAAGFDKNAVGVDGMAMLGFDHVEIGTVTGEPQPGNPKKRLFRLVADRALINRMGFNNEGSLAVAARLASRTPVFRTVVGVNIGKTKAVPEAEAVGDYVKSAERLAPYADYLVVNVSSPNTPGLRDLQAVDHLRPLLTAVREAADRAAPARRVPLLVKIAPDLADEDVDAVADLAVELGLDGIIATNTTIARAGLGLRSRPRRRPGDRRPVRRAPRRHAPFRYCAACTPAWATGSPWSASAASRTPRTPGSASWPAPRWSRATARSSTRAPSGPAPSTRGSPRACAPARTPRSPTRWAPR
ncbi:Dihydroorotate dehydrogenase (quinone) [Streptomyces hirsutus]